MNGEKKSDSQRTLAISITEKKQQELAGTFEERWKEIEAQVASLNSFQTDNSSDRSRKVKTGSDASP